MLSAEEKKIFDNLLDNTVVTYSIKGGPSRFDLMLYFWDTVERPDPFFEAGMRTAQLTTKLHTAESDDNREFYFDGIFIGATNMHEKAANLLAGKRVLIQYHVDKRYGTIAFPDILKTELDAHMQSK